MRITGDYESHSSEELLAEIEARRDERKNKAGANLFPGIDKKTTQPMLAAALVVDDRMSHAPPVPPTPEPHIQPHVGISGAPPPQPPAFAGLPISAEQKAAAAKDDPSFKAMSEREAAHGLGGRLPTEQPKK